MQGVTHVSRMVQYPADPSTDTPALWVAHFAHPIEAEWIARSAPSPKDWPRLLLQVCCQTSKELEDAAQITDVCSNEMI